MSVRVAIVGARAHPDLEMVRAYVGTLPEDAIVISGGAQGVDAEATREAARRGLAWEEYRFARCPNRRGFIRVLRASSLAPAAPTVWYDLPLRTETSVRDALILRNSLIVVNSDRVVAFPDGSKGGTFDALTQANRFRRHAELRWCDGRVEWREPGEIAVVSQERRPRV